MVMTISTAPSNSYLLLSALYSTGTMNITCSLHSVQYNNSNLPVLVPGTVPPYSTDNFR